MKILVISLFVIYAITVMAEFDPESMRNPQGKRSADITRPRFFKREVDTQMTGHNLAKRDTVTEKPKQEVETQTMARNRGTRDVTVEKPKVEREDEALKTAHSMNKRDIMEDSHRPQREADTQTNAHNLGKRDTVMTRPKRHGGGGGRGKRDVMGDHSIEIVKREGGGGGRGRRDVMADRSKDHMKRETENASTLPKTQGKRGIYDDDRRVKRDEATTLSLEPTTVAGRKKRETGTQNQFSGQKTASPIQG